MVTAMERNNEAINSHSGFVALRAFPKKFKSGKCQATIKKGSGRNNGGNNYGSNFNETTS